VDETTSSADGYPAPVETSSVDVARSDLDEVPTSGEPWLDDWLVAEMGRRVERPVEDPGRRPCVDHLDEPGVTVLQAGRPAPTVAIAVAVARLGDMGADLLRVGETLARGEAGFQRLVSRWNPADPWLQPGDQTP